MLHPKSHLFLFKKDKFHYRYYPVLEGNYHLLKNVFLHEKKNLFRLQAILNMHFLEFNTCEMLFYDYYMTH